MKRYSRGLAVLLVATPLALAGCASAPAPHPHESYGELPSFLPRDTGAPDSTLNGSVKRPALTTEGDAVIVELPAGAKGSERVVVTGPEVPGEGLPYQTDATTCTWTVTLSGATRRVAISVDDFSSIDHLGKVYHPTLVPGQPDPGRYLEPGQTITFDLRTVMAVGEGLMRFAPDGERIAASWDFEVEND